MSTQLRLNYFLKLYFLINFFQIESKNLSSIYIIRKEKDYSKHVFIIRGTLILVSLSHSFWLKESNKTKKNSYNYE